MHNNDLIQRFIFENYSVRGQWVRLSQSYCSIVNQHQYPPLIRKLLAEMLVVATMLSAIVKFKGRLTVQFQGKGKLKLLMAQCNQEFHLRGLAQWQSEIKEEELSHLFQEGLMVITIDPDKSGNRYQGMVAWEGNSLSQSIEGYFRTSEQLPTRLWIAVDDHSATGLLLQEMPKEISLGQHEDHNWEHLIHLTETVSQQELLTLDPVTLLRRLYAEEEVRIFQPDSVAFHCNCSVERSENALLILGREEVDEELKDKQKIVVTCDFCSKEYTFDRVDVARIFSKGGKPPSSTQVH